MPTPGFKVEILDENVVTKRLAVNRAVWSLNDHFHQVVYRPYGAIKPVLRKAILTPIQATICLVMVALLMKKGTFSSWVGPMTSLILQVIVYRLGEMEEIVKAHPSVAECAVIGVADDLKGQLPSMGGPQRWHYPV